MADQNEFVGKYVPEGPLPSWPGSSSNGTVSEAVYLKKLDYRLVSLGRDLDSLVKKIPNAEKAKEWHALKDKIASIKRNTNPYNKIDEVKAIESKTRAFADRLG
jgi:hypothetical protein